MEKLAELASRVTLDMGSVYFYKDNRPPSPAMEDYTYWLKSRQKAVDGMRELLSRSRLLGAEVDFVASDLPTNVYRLEGEAPIHDSIMSAGERLVLNSYRLAHFDGANNRTLCFGDDTTGRYVSLIDFSRALYYDPSTPLVNEPTSQPGQLLIAS